MCRQPSEHKAGKSSKKPILELRESTKSGREKVFEDTIYYQKYGSVHALEQVHHVWNQIEEFLTQYYMHLKRMSKDAAQTAAAEFTSRLAIDVAQVTHEIQNMVSKGRITKDDLEHFTNLLTK